MNLTRRGFLSFLSACALTLAFCGIVRATDYFVDANNITGTASDSNDGKSAGKAWLTLAKVQTALAYGTGQDGDTVNLCGTFRENIKMKVPARFTIQQWAGKPQAIIRGDTIPTWTETSGGSMRWTTTLAASSGTDGTASTIQDYVAAVVQDWDTRIDSKGRHYGFLARAANAAACTADSYKYFYDSATRVLTIGIGAGQIPGSNTTVAWCKGNCHGGEFGTPNYDNYPTGGTYSDNNRTIQLTVDGIHFYLWADSGLGARGSTVSVGHGLRVADAINSRVVRCTFISNGYHDLTFAGDCCYGNTVEDCVMWDCAPNIASGNDPFVFYTGPLGGLVYGNVDKCIARRLTIYKFWHLGVDGNPLATDASLASMTTGSTDGIICHTNGRGVTTGAGTAGAGGDTATASTDRITCTAANGQYDNEPVQIVDSTAAGLTAGTYYANRVSATLFTLSLTAGGAVVDITGNGAVHWYALNNVVKDALFEDVTIIESGKLSDNTMCLGQAAIGGNTTLPPVNPLKWSDYPVRYDRLKVLNGSGLRMSQASQIAYRRSNFQMDRAGMASSRGTGAFVGGAIGADSNDPVIRGRMLFEDCEITLNLDDGTNAAAGFQVSGDTSLYFLNTSIYDRSSRTRGTPSGTGTAGTSAGDTAATSDVITIKVGNRMSDGEAITVVDSTATGLTAGTRYVRDSTATSFKLATTVGGAAIDITGAGAIHWYAQGTAAMFNGPGGQSTSVIYNRGGIVAFRTARGNNLNYLTYGLRAAWCLTANAAFDDVWTHNVSVDSYNPYDGVGTQSNTAALWVSNVDATAVQTIDTSTANYNPFVDHAGATLELTRQAQQRKAWVEPHGAWGINERRYGGWYGARQYSPLTAPQVLVDRAMRN